MGRGGEWGGEGNGEGRGMGGRGMGGGGWFTSPLCRRRSNILLHAAAPSSNQDKT